MIKTIFGKIMWVNVIVLFLSFLFTGIMLFGMLGKYAVDQKAISLKEVAPMISEMTVSLQVERNSVVYNKIYNDNLETISVINGVNIIVANSNGEVFAKTSKIKPSVEEIDMQYMNQSLAGVATQFTGELGGIFDEKMLTVAYPIKYEKQVIGVIFLNVSMPNLDRDRLNTSRLFICVSAVVLLFAFVVCYIVSQRMTRALKNINKAAKSIALGNFKSRVYVSGKDEIAQLGATFNYMADSLQQLDDTQTSFIANVSHELRTPMTTISGFIENVLDGTIPPQKANEYLSIALSESKRLSRLVSDMLDISKMSLGQFNIDIKPFDVCEMIRLSIIKFENAIDEKKLDVSVDFCDESIRVLADRDSISRVVTNLMENAIKFSDPVSHLAIKVFTKNGKAYVAFSNEGFGIEKEDLPHVFDRFYKTDKSRNDKKGTGLGLYLVKNILSLHGENIVAQSIDISDDEYEGSTNHPQKRTTFIFSLELE